MTEFHSEATLFISGGRQNEYHHYIDASRHVESNLSTEKRHKQSPINIVTSDTIFDETLKDGDFKFDYKPDDFILLKNTGHTWELTLRDDSTSSLQAKHLNGTYKLVKIHCHWGDESTNGSEHTMDDCGFASEMHFVHYKLDYGTFEEATKHCDGLAVLGVLLKECDEDNPTLRELVKGLNGIKYKDQTTKLSSMNAEQLIPNKHDFWTYDGSLTTPPCTECVVWTVFSEPIPISTNQLNCFRSLCPVDEHNIEFKSTPMVNNVRPVQPINDRTIRASFINLINFD